MHIKQWIVASIYGVLFCVLFTVSSASVEESSIVWSKETYEYSILVDEKYENGSLCPSQRNTSCAATFSKALLNLKHSSTIIQISPGHYTLNYGQHITNKHHIAIVGRRETIIDCNHTASAGLMISSSEDINIRSIAFNDCSYDTHLEKLASEFRETHFPPSTLYFHSCGNVSISDVTIDNANGIGVCLIQTSGNTMIENCIVNRKQLETNEYDSVIHSGGVVAVNSRYTVGNLLLHNCTITNNHFWPWTTKEPEIIGCVINHAIGGIVLVNSPRRIGLNSSYIADNDIGIFIFDYNTHIKLDMHKDSKLINNSVSSKGFYSQRKMNIFFNVNVTTTSETSYDCKNSDNDVKISVVTYTDEESEIRYGPFSYSICKNSELTCYDNHAGTFCGQCKKDYGVAINSPYLACVPCSDSLTAFKGWILLVVLEFIPLTVMIALIAILNINLNQGSLKSYIFLCQMVTISLTFPAFGFPTWAASNNRAYSTLLLPFSIWNLHFINYPPCNWNSQLNNDCSSLSICILQNTSPLLAISFWYVIAFYPLVLVAAVYGFIVMYNRGYRCTVVVIRPFHRVLARLWRMLDIQPSLTHTVASVYTLCFTQLAATSVRMLQGMGYDGDLKFLYDGTQKYFQGWHGAAGSLAIILLVVFNIIPTIYCFVYPLKLFQTCFNKLKFKKDFIISVTDVFVGPYKDGTTDNSWDYRYFAGLHFFIQIVMMLMVCISTFFWSIYWISAIVFSCICGLLFIAVIIFRPYKRNVHSFSEAIVLISIGSLSGTGLLYLDYNNDDDCYYDEYYLVPYAIFIIPASVCYLFGLFACIRCFVWVLMKYKHAFAFYQTVFSKPTATAAANDKYTNGDQSNELYEDVDETTFADRLLNPDAYKNHTCNYDSISTRIDQ